MRCLECSTSALFDGKEVYCPRCGLVLDESPPTLDTGLECSIRLNTTR